MHSRSGITVTKDRKKTVSSLLEGILEKEKATALMKPDWIKATTRGTDLAFEIGSFVSAGRGGVGDLGLAVVWCVCVCVCVSVCV